MKEALEILRKMGVKKASFIGNNELQFVEFFDTTAQDLARAEQASTKQILDTIEKDYKEDILKSFDEEDQKRIEAKLEKRDSYWSS